MQVNYTYRVRVPIFQSRNRKEKQHRHRFNLFKWKTHMLTQLYTHPRKCRNKWTTWDMQTTTTSTMNHPTLNANQLINRISKDYGIQELRYICIASGYANRESNKKKFDERKSNQVIFMRLIKCWNSEINMNQRLFASAIFTPFQVLHLIYTSREEMFVCLVNNS